MAIGDEYEDGDIGGLRRHDDDNDDDDIYIMMSVCLFVCNEKWALPPGSLL